MSDKSTIEWTDATWNPIRGCVKVSPGCKHCYAETFAERWRGIAGHPYEQGFDLRLVPDKLDQPLRWKRGRRIFVNSMSDLFQYGVPFEYIGECFGVMAAARQHTFQVLSKRDPRPFFEWIDHRARVGARTEPHLPWWRAMAAASLIRFPFKSDVLADATWPLANVWMGASVEDRKYGLPRIDWLRDTPAAVRFLSIEPLLEDLGAIDLRGIDWVIVGGESGRGARPMNEDWVRSIRDQCAATGVRFFFKQRTENRRVVSLPVLDGRQWAEFPLQETT